MLLGGYLDFAQDSSLMNSLDASQLKVVREGIVSAEELGGSAIGPFLAKFIESYLSVNPISLALELGCGMSTLVISACLSRVKFGKLISIEEFESFATITNERLQRAGLDSYCDIVVCPMLRTSYLDQMVDWYDLPVPLADDGAVEFLLIDGPERRKGQLIRGPSLVQLQKALAPDCLIVLDDAGRESEKTIIQEWLKDPRLAVSTFGDEGKQFALISTSEDKIQKASSSFVKALE